MKRINITHRAPAIVGERLSRTQAGSLLGFSEAGVDKLLRSGFLPSLDIAAVLALSNVSYAETEGPLAVLRTGPEKPAADWDTSRTVIGTNQDHDDPTVLSCNDRWWRVDADRIEALGSYAVTIATFCVVVLRVYGVQDSESYTVAGGVTHQRYWFKAKLAGRCVNLATRQLVVVPKVADGLPYEVSDLCGYRIEAESGGPFAFIG